MKKLLLCSSIVAAALLSSCFNTRMYVGNVKPGDALVEVNKQWNSGFIYGLVPAKNAKMETNKFVNDAPDYVVRTYTSFGTGLVGGLTFGIYTPTMTKFYVPASSLNKVQKANKK